MLDNVTLSGGTDDLASAFSQVNTDSAIKHATLQDGTLAVASGQTLTLHGVTLAVSPCRVARMISTAPSRQ